MVDVVFVAWRKFRQQDSGRNARFAAREGCDHFIEIAIVRMRDKDHVRLCPVDRGGTDLRAEREAPLIR